MSSNKRNIPQTLAAKNDYCDLPITSDWATKKYASSSKIMMIFQGTCLNRSSAVILKLQTIFESLAFVINDHPAEYICGLPMSRLKILAKKAVEEGKKLIVINSSFSNLPLNRYYAALAHKASYITLVIPPIIKLPNGDTFLSNTYQPLYSAWFLNDADSDALCLKAKSTVLDVYENCPDFLNKLSASGFMPHNFTTIYQLRNTDQKSCVAKIFSNKKDVNEYFEKPPVRKNYGKSSKLEITAFVLTPYSMYAKIKLNSQQKELFDLEENSYDMPNYPSILQKQSLKSLPDVIVRCCPSENSSTLRTSPRNGDIFEMAVTPEVGKYAQSHINLGHVPKSPVHRRNIDAAIGAHMESLIWQVAIDIDLQEFDNYYVKRIDDFWFIYLKHSLTVEALFTTCCKPQ